MKFATSWKALLLLSVTVSGPGCILCASSGRQTEPAEGLALQEVGWRGNEAEVTSAALSIDGALSATGDAVGDIVVWDARSGAVVRRLSAAHVGEVRGLAFLPDGHRLVSGGVDGTIAVWNLDDARQLRRRRVPALVPGLRPAVEAVGVSRAAGRVIYGSEDGAWVVEADTWELVRAIDSPSERVALSPEGNRATTSDGSDVRIWDLTSGDEVGAFAARGAVAGLSFSDSPDRMVVTRATPTGSVASLVATTSGTVLSSTPTGGRILDASSGAGTMLVSAADGSVQLLATPVPSQGGARTTRP